MNECKKVTHGVSASTQLNETELSPWQQRGELGQKISNLTRKTDTVRDRVLKLKTELKDRGVTFSNFVDNQSSRDVNVYVNQHPLYNDPYVLQHIVGKKFHGNQTIEEIVTDAIYEERKVSRLKQELLSLKEYEIQLKIILIQDKQKLTLDDYFRFIQMRFSVDGEKAIQYNRARYEEEKLRYDTLQEIYRAKKSIKIVREQIVCLEADFSSQNISFPRLKITPVKPKPYSNKYSVGVYPLASDPYIIEHVVGDRAYGSKSVEEIHHSRVDYENQYSRLISELNDLYAHRSRLWAAKKQNPNILTHDVVILDSEDSKSVELTLHDYIRFAQMRFSVDGEKAIQYNRARYEEEKLRYDTIQLINREKKDIKIVREQIIQLEASFKSQGIAFPSLKITPAEAKPYSNKYSVGIYALASDPYIIEHVVGDRAYGSKSVEEIHHSRVDYENQYSRLSSELNDLYAHRKTLWAIQENEESEEELIEEKQEDQELQNDNRNHSTETAKAEIRPSINELQVNQAELTQYNLNTRNISGSLLIVLLAILIYNAYYV